jgi:hypothetical protein
MHAAGRAWLQALHTTFAGHTPVGKPTTLVQSPAKKPPRSNTKARMQTNLGVASQRKAHEEKGEDDGRRVKRRKRKKKKTTIAARLTYQAARPSPPASHPDS